MKHTIKLTESDLHRLIKGCVNQILRENTIEIDPKNKGKFNATKKRTGKSTAELTHSKNPLTRKRANFARMAKRGWKPLKESNESIGSFLLESFDPDMDVIVVGGEKQGEYKAGELGKYFELGSSFQPDPSMMHFYKDSKIIGYPKLMGYVGPMWDGDRIRYETQEVYNAMSI